MISVHIAKIKHILKILWTFMAVQIQCLVVILTQS